MNERIKELITKSNGYWEHGDFNMPRTVCFDETDVEKFAELIVQECSNFLKDTLDDHFAAEQLEEHFGVEE